MREELPQLGGDAPRRDRALVGAAGVGAAQDLLDDLRAGPGTRVPEERLGAVVVTVGPELVATRLQRILVPVGVVAGPRRRGRLDVVLGVVAHTEREQLHQLTREVLVRLALVVLDAVAVGPGVDAVLGVGEVHQHRGIDRHRLHQIDEVAERVLPVRLELAHHPEPAVDVPPRADQMTVPEQHHLLEERARSVGHHVDPPRTGVDVLVPPVRGVRHEVRRRGGRCVDREHVVDRLLTRHRQELGDATGAGDEFGPSQQVFGVGLVGHSTLSIVSQDRTGSGRIRWDPGDRRPPDRIGQPGMQ